MDWAWLRAAGDVAISCLTIVLIGLLLLAAIPAAAAIELHYSVRTTQQQALDWVIRASVFGYCLGGAAFLWRSVTGDHRLRQWLYFLTSTLAFVTLLTVKYAAVG